MHRRVRGARRRLANFGMLMLVGLAIGLAMGRSTRPAARSPEDDEPRYATTLFTADAALRRSMAEFPAGRSPHGAVAHLVSVDTYSNTLGTIPRDRDPEAPIWTVAILGDGLAVADVVKPPVPVASPDERPAVGAEYLWDANSGGQIAAFALLDMSAYESIRDLADEPIVVQPATFAPPMPTSILPNTAAPAGTPPP